MTHKLKFNGVDVEVHSFDFSYSTDHVNGAPAQHGGAATLDVEVQMETSQDKDGANYKAARKLFHESALEGVDLDKEKLRRAIVLEALQSAYGDGSRKLECQGWLVSYSESSHGGPNGANSDVLRARFFVFAKGKQEKQGPKIS